MLNYRTIKMNKDALTENTDKEILNTAIINRVGDVLVRPSGQTLKKYQTPLSFYRTERMFPVNPQEIPDSLLNWCPLPIKKGYQTLHHMFCP
jgi:hypothetical protein